jgi:hypothetical protein
VKSRPPLRRNALAGEVHCGFLLRVADAVELKTVGQARSARVH